MMKPAELTLTKEWDKTFPKSDKVDHSKVTFINRYGITLAADLYVPKGGLRPLRSRQGAVLRAVCADDGGARLSDACL